MVDERRHQVKRSLEQRKKIAAFTGLLDEQYTEAPIVVFARRFITHALFKHHVLSLKETEEQAAIYLNEAEIVLLEEPQEETETLSLLKEKRIEYPSFYSGVNLGNASAISNSLNHLSCIYKVNGYHKQEQQTGVELLIGGYWTHPGALPLGRRVGYEWVSPIYSRSE